MLVSAGCESSGVPTQPDGHFPADLARTQPATTWVFPGSRLVYKAGTDQYCLIPALSKQGAWEPAELTYTYDVPGPGLGDAVEWYQGKFLEAGWRTNPHLGSYALAAYFTAGWSASLMSVIGRPEQVSIKFLTNPVAGPCGS